MIYVIDANAAIEMAIKNPFSTAIRAILDESKEILSSSLFYAEVGNSIAKYIKGGYIGKNEGVIVAELCISFVDEFIPIQDNFLESMAESVRLNHSVYDMLYLTIARRNGAGLITLDNKLRTLAAGEGIMIYPKKDH